MVCKWKVVDVGTGGQDMWLKVVYQGQVSEEPVGRWFKRVNES